MNDVVRNSLGMRLVRIEAGSFLMGGRRRRIPGALGPKGYPHEHPPFGDYDEFPAHRVRITRPFHMAVCPVTNRQYEAFDPAHRRLRGKLGFSRRDDEAVVFVSWHEATAFCRWLSEQERRPYRLPTEAEWEYACRAGTGTLFHTGDTLPPACLHRNRIEKWRGPAWYPGRRQGNPAVSLRVGRTPPNAWGLRDLHGLVEEWCLDWYGPYPRGAQSDPVGRADGDFKVTRGGSHTTDIYFLRSANRMGTLPEDRHWLIGFRVVLAPHPETRPLPPPRPPANARRVSQRAPAARAKRPDPEKPFFVGPRRYVKVPAGACGPMYARHNHDPGLCACPNGDLLAIWYSCIDEPGRELCLLASRLRYGREEWDAASPFWDPPDRNAHAPALWYDGERTIYHFCGLSAAATWGNLALVMRTSRDSGATWSKPRLIAPEHGPVAGRSFHMPINSVIRTREGAIVLPCDATGSTALYISRDGGETWREARGLIRGIHAGVVQLRDGRLMALGRGDDIAGRMPVSLSDDLGETWTYRPSPFAPITLGQRLALIRLWEGPLFFASFCGTVPVRYANGRPGERRNGEDLAVLDAAGRERRIRGLFAALSFDEGETWPVRRVIAPSGRPRRLRLTHGTTFVMNAVTGEPQGYLAATQSADGIIHLITSQRHYAFNLAWLKAPMAAGA